MDVNGDKLMRLIAHYGKQKGYEEKSYLRAFTQDLQLNYTQWAAYTRGSQNLGIKIIDILINAFPNLNLNWLLKDDDQMFLGNSDIKTLNEPSSVEYGKPENAIMDKLEAIHNDIKQMQKNYNLSQN